MSEGEQQVVKSFRDLTVWQEAMELAVLCYQITAGFPKSETFGLSSQIRSCVGSVHANIAEGSGRRTTADFIHFLDIANGSLKELDSHFELARRLGFVEDNVDLVERIQRVGKMLTRLKQALRSANRRPSKHQSPSTKH